METKAKVGAKIDQMIRGGLSHWTAQIQAFAYISKISQVKAIILQYLRTCRS